MTPSQMMKKDAKRSDDADVRSTSGVENRRRIVGKKRRMKEDNVKSASSDEREDGGSRSR